MIWQICEYVATIIEYVIYADFMVRFLDVKKDTGDDKTPAVIASTASPFKFTRSVMEALKGDCDKAGDFELVDELSKVANVKVPKAIEDIRNAKVLHNTVCDKDKMCDTVCDILGL